MLPIETLSNEMRETIQLLWYKCKLSLGQISAFLRSVPSPVQGTSQRIRSNLSGASLPASAPGAGSGTSRLGMIEASWLVTTMHGDCSLLTWLALVSTS